VAGMTHIRKDFLRTEIASANAFITDSQIKGEKYRAMKQSPFQFYRATDHLYYSDLSNGTINIPDIWKVQANTHIWLSGDFHTQNIGYVNDRTGKVIFDLNDADESYIGPFYWDLLCFATSLYLLTGEINKTHQSQGSNFSYAASEQESLVAHFLQTYQDTLQLVDGNNEETLIAMDESHLDNGFVRISPANPMSKILSPLQPERWPWLMHVQIKIIVQTISTTTLSKRTSLRLPRGSTSKRPLIACLKAIISKCLLTIKCLLTCST
jgi:hypothetical protein